MQFFSDVLTFCMTLFESSAVFHYFFGLPFAASTVIMSLELLHFGGDRRD